MTMDSNIVTFPDLSPKRGRANSVSSEQEEAPKKAHWRPRIRNEPNMQRLLFRSSHLIVESDEADLVRDVCFAVDRAQTKLKRIQRRLKGVQEQAATQVQLLTAAETKLAAAIVVALLSTREGKSDGS
jgi:hypothetical protein